MQITNRQFGLHKYMNWLSEFNSTKANLHSLCHLESSLSLYNSFSSSLEDWELAFWLGFSAILSLPWLQISKKVFCGDGSVSTQLEFCCQPARKPREQLNGFQFWLVSFVSFSFLIGRLQWTKSWILQFSPQNTPQCLMKLV